MLNGQHVGADTAVYVTDTLSNNDSVLCERTSAAHDTVYATSDVIVMIVDTTIPDAGVISGTVTRLCVGSTALLTDTTSGGAWGASNDLATVANGLVTAIKPGFNMCPYPENDTLFYVKQDGLCTDTASYIITIEPLPSASFDLPKTTYCLGEPITIIGPCPSAVFSVPSYSDNELIRVKLFGVSSNYCGTDTTNYYMTVTYIKYLTDTPVINIETTEICKGGRVKISSPTNPSKEYWKTRSGNAFFISDRTGFYLEGKEVGLDTIILRYRNTCGTTSRSDTVIVSVNPQPEHSPALFGLCVGQLVKLTDSTSGGTWSSSGTDVAIIEPSSGQVVGAGKGRTTVTYTLPTGCYGTRKIAVDDCAGEITLFPNPSNNEIIVQQQSYLPYDACTILNMTGEAIFTKTTSTTYTIIDISALPTGLYFARLTGAKGAKTLRFLKE